MASITVAYTNEQQRQWGAAAANYSPASTREVADRFNIADTTEVSVQITNLPGARMMWVENLSSVTDNTLSVGLATGVYITEIPPGQRSLVWLVGKPDNPQLFFKQAVAGGGDVQYVLRN